jgi:hypothetical protein
VGAAKGGAEGQAVSQETKMKGHPLWIHRRVLPDIDPVGIALENQIYAVY